MSVDVKKRWAGEAVDRRAPVAAFKDALGELMDGDDRVVVLVTDLAVRSGIGELEEQYGDRFFNVGGAEATLVGIAAGLAANGKLPVALTRGTTVSTVSALLGTIVAPTKLHVVVAGLPAGLAGTEGAAGHGLNDLAALSAIPGMRVVVPSDAEETAKVLITLVDDPGPGYLRLSDEPLPQITGPDSPFDLGQPHHLRDGTALTMVACGALVYEALVAADLLEDQGIDARVLAAHTVQPLDGTALVAAAGETGALVVAEEHAARGGLGSAVAQILVGSHPVPVEHLHAGDGFVGAGSNEALRVHLGLHAEGIAAAAQRVLSRKT